MKDAALPYPPVVRAHGHQSVTNREQLFWYRTIIISVLALSLVSLTGLVDELNGGTNETVVEAVDTLVQADDTRALHEYEAYSGLIADEVDNLIQAVRDVGNDVEANGVLIKRTNTQLNTISSKLSIQTDQLIEMESAQAATAVVIGLIHQQLTNLLAMTTEGNTKLTALVETTESLTTMLSEEFSLTQVRDDERNSLLASIDASVAYDELRFRKKVRTALIGTTIIATTEYEAGGQCDIIPEECTLVGETEIEVEDVLGV
nr:Hypothetical protein 2 CDS [Astacus astacus]